MVRLDRAQFDHWGIPTGTPQPNEEWMESSRVWLTNPRKHPASVEFLRYMSDSPVPEFRRTNPHIAFRVDDIEDAVRGLQILSGPYDVPGQARLAFVLIDGVVVELMQWFDPSYEGWFV